MIGKLLVDRCIDIGGLAVPANVGAAAHGFQRVAANIIHIAESENRQAGYKNPVLPTTADFGDRLGHKFTRFGNAVKSNVVQQKTSDVMPGAHATKLHRNFLWLPWIPGVVSEVPSAGMNVLTGPLTGCWVTRYTRNGVQCVGHVGTELDANTPNSLAAKGSWNAFAGGVGAQFAGFNVARNWAGNIPRINNDGAGYFMALVTDTGDFYAVVAWQNIKYPNRVRIAGTQLMMNQLPANGQI
jgi:hypothetical protein